MNHNEKGGRCEQTAFFSTTVLDLHFYKCILGCIADRASPVIRKVFKLFALFRFIINVAANRASPHNGLLKKDNFKSQSANPK